MIPSAWAAVVLALAAFRLARLVGWDDFPPIQWLRDQATGARQVTSGSFNSRNGLTNEPVDRTVVHRRPTLSRFLWCAFCSGWWVSVGLYLAWRWEPSWTLTACFPFALSGAVGLIAKNLDP